MELEGAFISKLSSLTVTNGILFPDLQMVIG